MYHYGEGAGTIRVPSIRISSQPVAFWHYIKYFLVFLVYGIFWAQTYLINTKIFYNTESGQPFIASSVVLRDKVT